jgi:hypothetical protein
MIGLGLDGYDPDSQLVGLGAIFGGRAWLDEELNTAESMAAGVLYCRDYSRGADLVSQIQ